MPKDSSIILRNFSLNYNQIAYVVASWNPYQPTRLTFPKEIQSTPLFHSEIGGAPIATIETHDLRMLKKIRTITSCDGAKAETCDQESCSACFLADHHAFWMLRIG